MTNKEQMEVFNAVVKAVSEEIPGFEIRYKDESWSSKVIGVLVWLFNRDYMTKFTTTRYPRVYFPSREFVRALPLRAAKILAHEFVHLSDRRNDGLWFSIGYAMPQLLGVLLLPVFVVLGFLLPTSYWWVMLIVGVLMVACIAPLPAYCRMIDEMRGYAMNLAFNFWRYGSISERTKEWMTGIFVGPAYYFMWPFRNGVRRRIDEVELLLKRGLLKFNGAFGNSCRPYLKMYALLKERGLLNK